MFLRQFYIEHNHTVW